MERDPTQAIPVALDQLRSAEWHRLTFGLWWRSVIWTLLAVLVGTVVSYLVAFGLTRAMGPTLDPVAYRRLAIPITLMVNLGVAFLMFRMYARWILTGRYGPLRLVVVRDTLIERQVATA